MTWNNNSQIWLLIRITWEPTPDPLNSESLEVDICIFCCCCCYASRVSVFFSDTARDEGHQLGLEAHSPGAP